MDELLKRVAEIRGMPASLIERSAQARAEKTGMTLEAVLLEWAGEEKGAEANEPESEPADEVAEVEESPAADAPDPQASEPQAPEPETSGASVAITTDYLVQLAADAKRMPPKLILSSATARAEHSNTTLESVLADWAGVDLKELESRTEAAPPVGAPEPAETIEEKPPAASSESDTEAKETVAAEPAIAVAAALTMDELLDKVAAIKGMPASLTKRSAEARAKKTGDSLEAVLADWAGVDVGTIASTPPETVDEPVGQTAPKPEAEEPESGVEIIEASEPTVEDTIEDAPRSRGRYPRWLAAAFVLLPLLAVGYILVAPDGPDCGTAGQLLVDPVTGEAVNCDGSEYGTSAADYFADGAVLYAQCVACHAADGSGGAGPAFSGGAILSTFPAGSCAEQIEWIRLGTAGWPEPSYGATSTPVGSGGLMPAFGGGLTDEQLAAVSLYERVQFGGQPLEEAEIDCGLVEAGDAESVEAAGS